MNKNINKRVEELENTQALMIETLVTMIGQVNKLEKSFLEFLKTIKDEMEKNDRKPENKA